MKDISGENKMNISTLKEKLIDDCIKSGLTYSEVMRALRGTNWYFSSKAETFLKNTDIKKISEVELTQRTEDLPEPVADALNCRPT